MGLIESDGSDQGRWGEHCIFGRCYTMVTLVLYTRIGLAEIRLLIWTVNIKSY